MTQVVIVNIVWILALLLFYLEPLREQICDELLTHLRAEELHFGREWCSLRRGRLSEFGDDAGTGSASVALNHNLAGFK